MICSLEHNGSLLFQEIDPFLAELIIQPFQQKGLSSQIINRYLFKKLTKQDPLFSQDWKEYIVPELETLFTSCHKQVLADLESLHKHASLHHHYTLTIPLDHRDAWLRMLSMIRLLISSQGHIDHQILQIKDHSTLQAKALLQMEVFALILQCLVEAEMV